MRLLAILVLVMPLLTGCETLETSIQESPTASDSAEPRRKPKPKKSGEPLLAAGVVQFEEGNYVQAERLLRSSLAAGLATGAIRARAHKYLAFLYCISNRTAQCREEFSHALRADPAFSLTAAEAGHPTWGPAFRSVTQGR